MHASPFTFVDSRIYEYPQKKDPFAVAQIGSDSISRHVLLKPIYC